MRTLLPTLGMLLGLFLCVAGIATVLVTGLDLRWGAAGLAVAAGGAALLWFLQRRVPSRSGPAEPAGAPRRSRPLPPSADHRPPIHGSRDRM